MSREPNEDGRMNLCPHCDRFSRCHRCEGYSGELALVAVELAFWKHQAKWHNAYLKTRPAEPDEIDLAQAEAELERSRQAENRARHAYAEPPREIGS